MKLIDLIKELEYTVLQGSLDVTVEGLTADSRAVARNGVFIAIKGAVSDGHKYIASAMEAGAAVIVLSDTEAVSEYAKDVTVLQTENTRLALALMSAAYYGYPARELFTIGITGTKGKTTTTYMIKSVLESCGIKTGLIGTIETIIGDEHIPAKNTTPESIKLHETFRRMADEGIRAVVMEVSSQGIKLDRTAGIMFDIGVFTNLALDHVGPDEHESFEEYKWCKSRLFKQCKLGIVNGDDSYVEDIIKEATCKIEKFGLEASNDYYAADVELFHEMGHIGLNYSCRGLKSMDVSVHLPGLFTVYNSLCAIAVTDHLSVDNEALKAALLDVKVKGRMELVPVSNDFSLMIDYAHNAMSLKSILEDLRQYHPNRLICVFGCGGNRSKDRRFDMGKVSGELADLTVITSDNPRFEEPEAIAADIESAVIKTGGEYVKIIDRAEAIKYAISIGRPGDIIIVAGKGHEDYQEIKGVRYPMDERTLVSEAVSALKNEGVEGLI